MHVFKKEHAYSADQCTITYVYRHQLILAIQMYYTYITNSETKINYSNVFALCEHVTLFSSSSSSSTCVSFSLLFSRRRRTFFRHHIYIGIYFTHVLCTNIRLLSATLCYKIYSFTWIFSVSMGAGAVASTRKSFNEMCSRKLFHHFQTMDYWTI